MVIEIADFSIRPGSEEEFAAAYQRAWPQIVGASGFRSARMTRGIESTSRFVLIVEWDSVTDHTEGFRTSPAYQRWRELIGPYFAGEPTVEHFEDVPASV